VLSGSVERAAVVVVDVSVCHSAADLTECLRRVVGEEYARKNECAENDDE